MKNSRPSSFALSFLLTASVFSFTSLNALAEDPTPTADKTKKEIKADEKAEKKKNEAEIMANDPHPLIKNIFKETSVGLNTGLGGRYWDKSQQDVEVAKKFKSGMTAEFYGRQILVFDPKRNSLRAPGDKIYGYFSAESKSNLGGGAGIDKTSQWKTSTTGTVLNLTGGAQFGDKFNSIGDQSGIVLGGGLVIDSESGKKKNITTGKKETEFKNLTVDLQGQLGIGAFQFKDNLVKLMVPVGFRFKNEQEPDFQASKLKGAMVGFGFETIQTVKTKKNKSVVIKGTFDESQAWLTNSEGKSVNEFAANMGLKVIFPIKKSPIQYYVRGAFSGRNEKDYDANSTSPKTPIRSTSNIGGEIGTGIVF